MYICIYIYVYMYIYIYIYVHVYDSCLGLPLTCSNTTTKVLKPCNINPKS